jgi:hypothetical protein
VVVRAQVIGAMKRLILTSKSGFGLHGAGLADLVIHFCYRFGWGQLPSPDELSAYLGARSEEQGPGHHWSDYARRDLPMTRKDKTSALSNSARPLTPSNCGSTRTLTISCN